MRADVFEALRTLRRALSRAMTSAFAETGAGGRQLLILRELRAGGPVSQAELARATLTDPAAVMRALTLFERRGWVERTGVEGDRRRKLVSLRPAGLRALEELDGPFEALRAVANGALSLQDRERFCALTEKVAAALDPGGATADQPLPPAPAGARRPRRKESR